MWGRGLNLGDKNLYFRPPEICIKICIKICISDTGLPGGTCGCADRYALHDTRARSNMGRDAGAGVYWTVCGGGAMQTLAPISEKSGKSS